MKRRVIISVSDKTGVTDLARRLVAIGWEIVSSGGTAAALAGAGIPVTPVSDVTGFPECLDGRVKTLHPAVHAGILARRGVPEHMQQLQALGVTPVDLVVVNLYPFRQTVARPGVTWEEAVEQIDIGGPSLIRAAAKNHASVTVVVDPADYERVLGEYERDGDTSDATRRSLAGRAFRHTAAYDAFIAQWFGDQLGVHFPEQLTRTWNRSQDLRYGENPHQAAALYKDPLPAPGSVAMAEQLGGKELSFNNIGDADAALSCLGEFPADVPTVVALKHSNPCGVGTGCDLMTAWRGARDGDPVSVYGGVVALNGTVDEPLAASLAKLFLEIVAAPGYTDGALQILRKKKNLRVLRVAPATSAPGECSLREVRGGLLVQDRDTLLLGEEPRVVTRRSPTAREQADLLFAWRVVKHVTSNAIVLARDGATIGVGPGQTNRIWALQNAIRQSTVATTGSVLASDAFFPFADCVQAAAVAGIRAIIQPGGSILDADSIAAADEAGIAMLFTGVRHFRHQG
ncbi:MAG: bifunctional phosphoribosylaminoimidazolecarboxamide formyltransferase/IMP cyclohydrolase [Candidatus Cryosericum sp.]|nr:bifunctional phosphoribosylaminoimidazolecarboxamide formyltransferase/IMP cyclohydrolase [bacterium]